MIEFTTKKYKCSTMLESSILPTISRDINIQSNGRAFIEDYEGLYIGYGSRDNCYPYRNQNHYIDETLQDVQVAILQNEYLYAEFLPSLGGRLWKLKNKKTGQDILYHNDVIRFRNLATRNAWFSGGVEWNIGIIGHTPYTCDNLYCAKVTGKNGEEVLRFYEFERVREVYYQIDCWLDKDKLYVRVSIHNNQLKTVPMYWWSNIATPEYKGGRVIVPANSAYNNSDGIGITKSKIPFDKGVDVSYPENIVNTIDYFYDISEKSPKFIANVDSSGCGLLQYSSCRLKGRKLFSWGHVPGSKHWQEQLTENAGDYVEIQAGLGKTQYECIPMPPKTHWDWIECYTSVELDIPVSSEYDKLVECVKGKFSSDFMDELCEKTYDSIAMVKGDLISKGHGYGYLNDIINHNCPKHLQFDICADSKKWLDLFETGKLCNANVATDFLCGDSMEKLLLDNEKENNTNWLLYYQLALIEYDMGSNDKALSYAEQSLLLDNNFQNNHLYMNLLKNMGDSKFVYYAEKILKIKNDNFSVVEDIFKMLLSSENYQLIVDSFDTIEVTIKNNARIKLYYAVALFNVGNAKKAEEILLDKSFVINDFREGDKMLNNLYRNIREKLYGEKRENVVVPINLDFVVVKQ